MLAVIANISLLVDFLFNLLCYSLATHKTCTHIHTLDHWIYQHKTYIVFFSPQLDARAIDFLGKQSNFCGG